MATTRKVGYRDHACRVGGYGNAAHQVAAGYSVGSAIQQHTRTTLESIDPTGQCQRIDVQVRAAHPSFTKFNVLVLASQSTEPRTAPVLAPTNVKSGKSTVLFDAVVQIQYRQVHRVLKVTWTALVVWLPKSHLRLEPPS